MKGHRLCMTSATACWNSGCPGLRLRTCSMNCSRLAYCTNFPSINDLRLIGQLAADAFVARPLGLRRRGGRCQHTLYVAGNHVHLEIDPAASAQMLQRSGRDGMRNQVDAGFASLRAVNDLIHGQADAVDGNRALVSQVPAELDWYPYCQKVRFAHGLKSHDFSNSIHMARQQMPAECI